MFEYVPQLQLTSTVTPAGITSVSPFAGIVPDCQVPVEFQLPLLAVSIVANDIIGNKSRKNMDRTFRI